MSAKTEVFSPRQYYARGGKMRTGLTTDDVLLVPRAAPEAGLKEEWGEGFVRIIPDELFNSSTIPERDLSSRSNVDTTTILGRGVNVIKLHIPIVSSPMADVTGAELAIALGKEGGVGIIHRAQTITEEAKEVEQVKNEMGFVFERPPTLPPSATVYDARQEMNKANRGVVIVTDLQNHVLGIVTRRDTKKDVAPQDAILQDVMTPQSKLVTVIPELDSSDPQAIFVNTGPPDNQRIKATELMWKNRVEKLVIVDSEGRLVGVITDYDLRQFREYPNATIDKKGRLIVGAALGIGEKFIERAEAVIAAGADFLCIDVANAYLKKVREAVEILKRRFPDIPLMVGSIATRQGVRLLADAGADIIRDGIGSGSICITRGVSGCGYPLFSSVLEVADEADKFGMSVVADGGIRDSADIAKLLAAGARAVMLGRLLAATEEANGRIIIDPETRVRYREYRGMASEEVRQELERAEGRKTRIYSKRPEGVSRRVVIVGSVRDVVNDLIRGLSSGMTYGGVTTIDQLRDEVDFILITPAGQRESGVQVFP